VPSRTPLRSATCWKRWQALKGNPQNFRLSEIDIAFLKIEDIIRAEDHH
jgi:hypothetical protein